VKIAIVGGGAVGLLFANYLTKANHHVTIVVRRKEQEQQLRSHGVKLYGHERTEIVEALTFDELQSQTFDLVIITVKQTAIKTVVNTLKMRKLIAKDIMFVQNGMGHIHYMKELLNCFHSCYIGIVEHGAKKLSDFEVHHTGIGKVSLGILHKNHEKIHELANELSFGKFPFEVSHDWEMILKRKLVINAVINPLTALFQVRNGELLHNEHFIGLMRALLFEAVSVLQLPDEEEMWQYVKRICEKTASNHSSMLMDLTNGRETEIEAISGHIIEKAEEQQKNVPFTSFVYESIKGLTSHKR
jgi:2-dehydropantoate 2-reductase